MTRFVFRVRYGACKGPFCLNYWNVDFASFLCTRVDILHILWGFRLFERARAFCTFEAVVQHDLMVKSFWHSATTYSATTYILQVVSCYNLLLTSIIKPFLVFQVLFSSQNLGLFLRFRQSNSDTCNWIDQSWVRWSPLEQSTLRRPRVKVNLRDRRACRGGSGARPNTHRIHPQLGGR